MRMIILDYVRKKMADKKFSAVNRKLLFQEMQKLSELVDLGEMELRDYIKKQNGKKLKGIEKIPVFKYRLNDSDRLVYIYSKHLAWLADSEPEAVVIVDCIGHDEQAKWRTPLKKQNCIEMKELLEIGKNVKDLADEMEREILDVSRLEIDFLAQDQVYGYFSEEYAAYVLTDEEFTVCDVRDLEVSLSKKQGEAIQKYQKNPAPTLILGGAGSGKTIMVIHMLYNYLCTHPNSKCIYFTQSDHLKKQSEEKLKRIFKNAENASFKQGSVVYPETNVTFANINTYCCERLGWQEENLIKLDQFQTFIEEADKSIKEIFCKKKINLYDLWAEIRGTIKGGLDQRWHRCGWFSQQDHTFPIGFVKELEKEKMIERNPKDLKKFRFTEEVMNKKELAAKMLPEKYQICFNKLLTRANSIDSAMKMMDLESYLQLSGEESTLEKESRAEWYQICQAYQKWLGSQKYDENDLILKMFEQREEEKEHYDLVIVDEVQDYTELQIYFITKLAASIKGIILAGDQQQIINPTIFNESRIKTLFENRLQIVSLSRNFRCQEKVVAYARAISSLSNIYIGKGNQKEEEYSERKGSEPIRMNYSVSEVKKLLKFIAPYPNIAVLVPNFEVKEKLKNLIGIEVYNAYDNDFIHTVSEIKGMEYPYVICYDLVGYYQKEWQEIMKRKAAKKNTKYRYYFNLIYVGVSRAQEKLCLIDETENLQYEQEIAEQLEYKVCKLDRFDEKKMALDSFDDTEEDWLLQARREKEAGLYQKAVQSYRHTAAPSEEVWECMLYYYKEEQQYGEALKYAVLLKDKVQMEWLLLKVEKKQPEAKLAELWLNPSTFSKRKNFRKDSVIQWIDACLEKSKNLEKYNREEWEGRLLLHYTDLLVKITKERVKQIQAIKREK